MKNEKIEIKNCAYRLGCEMGSCGRKAIYTIRPAQVGIRSSINICKECLEALVIEGNKTLGFDDANEYKKRMAELEATLAKSNKALRIRNKALELAVEDTSLRMKERYYLENAEIIIDAEQKSALKGNPMDDVRNCEFIVWEKIETANCGNCGAGFRYSQNEWDKCAYVHPINYKYCPNCGATIIGSEIKKRCTNSFDQN